MYDVVSSILGSSVSPEIISVVSGVLCIILTVLFIDCIKEIIRSFIHG